MVSGEPSDAVLGATHGLPPISIPTVRCGELFMVSPDPLLEVMFREMSSDEVIVPTSANYG